MAVKVLDRGQHGGSPDEIAASGDYKNSDREKIISRSECSVRPVRAVAKGTGLSRGVGFIGKFDIECREYLGKDLAQKLFV